MRINKLEFMPMKMRDKNEGGKFVFDKINERIHKQYKIYEKEHCT